MQYTCVDENCNVAFVKLYEIRQFASMEEIIDAIKKL
jgi:hypothetical protein